jgi:chemotaxis protein histidine kinase CheA
MSDDIVREFLVESNENLDLLDRELVLLEKDPQNKDTLSSVFRTIHTIKGTCGFLGFSKLDSVAQVGENLLSKLRDGVMQLNPEITTALLKLVDAIREMLKSIEGIGTEGERDDNALIETLTVLHRGVKAAPPSSPPPPTTPAALAEENPETVIHVPSIGPFLIERGQRRSCAEHIAWGWRLAKSRSRLGRHVRRTARTGRSLQVLSAMPWRCLLEAKRQNTVESRVRDSCRGVAQPGSAPALGAPILTPTVDFSTLN